MNKFTFLMLLMCPLLLAAQNWQIKIAEKLTTADAAGISQSGIAIPGSKKVDIKSGTVYPLYKLSGKIKRGTKLRTIAFTVIESEKDAVRYIGIGADWFFTAFLNGKKILSTEPGGNKFTRISPYNHIAQVQLKAGKNFLAIFIRPNVYQWKFACKVLPEMNMIPAHRNDREQLISALFPPKNPGLLRKELIHQLSCDSAAVSCEFGTPVICGIRYRKSSDPAEKSKLLWHTRAGKRLIRKIHRFELSGLEAATEYSYDIVKIDIDTAKIITVSSGKFKTFPAQGVEHSFVAISDTQAMPENRKKAMTQFARMPQTRDAAFLVSLGDVSEHFDDFEPHYFDYYLNMLPKNQCFKPVTLVRGNHEYRGEDTEVYPEHFGRTYYAFRHGEVFYIVLDTGEGADTIWKPGNHLLTTDTEQLFREQIEFLEKIIETPECKNAKYRIVLAHASPFKYHAKFYGGSVRKLTEKFFFGTDPRCKIDLWLCAHVHYASRFDPATKTMVGFPFAKRSKLKIDPDDLADINFPVVTNDGPGQGGEWLSFTTVKVTPAGLQVTIRSIDGKVLDDAIIEKGKPHTVKESILKKL